MPADRPAPSPVADGMIVTTRPRPSRRATAPGRRASSSCSLNHPLDCPVCDKGGECPLQDLTFRYGPGASPLDRGRSARTRSRSRLGRRSCSTASAASSATAASRFHARVAEDEQLIARERGADTVIATFDEQPVRLPRSRGNTIELCPVGALTCRRRTASRPGRGISSNVPSVCARLRGRLQHVDRRCARASAERVLSRNHPRSTTAGSATAAASRATSRSSRPPERAADALASRARATSRWDEATRTIGSACATPTPCDGPGSVAIVDRRQPHQRGGLRLGPHRARHAARGRRPAGRGRAVRGSCSTPTPRGSTTSTAPT